MVSKSRPIDLPLLPQYSSIVLVLRGSAPPQLDKDLVTAAFGRAPSRRLADPTIGSGWLWMNEHFVVLTRTQGPDRIRLEVKQELPSTIDFDKIQSVMLEVLGAAAGLPTQSVGINHGVAVLDYTGTVADGVVALVDKDATKAWLGSTPSTATELKLGFPFNRNKLRGRRNVQFRVGKVTGGTSGVVLDVNYDIQTPSGPEAVRALSNDMIKAVTADLRRLVKKISRVAD